MQPKIIKNFISKDMCKYIDNRFVNTIRLDDQGYANIFIDKMLPYYDEYWLLNTLNKNDIDDAFFYDVLNLLKQNIKFHFNFKTNEICAEFFNYRNFGVGQNFKNYHTDDYGNFGTMYTAILYTTDDYKGGEITFYDGGPEELDKSTTYTPEAGDLFLFPGITPHSVNPVLSGRRALFTMNLRTPPATEPLKF